MRVDSEWVGVLGVWEVVTKAGRTVQTKNKRCARWPSEGIEALVVCERSRTLHLTFEGGMLHLCLSSASESWDDVSSMQPMRAHGFWHDCGYALWLRVWQILHHRTNSAALWWNHLVLIMISTTLES